MRLTEKNTNSADSTIMVRGAKAHPPCMKAWDKERWTNETLPHWREDCSISNKQRYRIWASCCLKFHQTFAPCTTASPELSCGIDNNIQLIHGFSNLMNEKEPKKTQRETHEKMLCTYMFLCGILNQKKSRTDHSKRQCDNKTNNKAQECKNAELKCECYHASMTFPPFQFAGRCTF